jgi:hypothetical protein
MITKIPFETEDDLRETFDFLLELPVEFKTLGFGEMTNFPTYDFTSDVEKNAALINNNQRQVTEELYDYYNKLYLITRTPMPREEVRAIGNDPQYRAHPERLNQFINNETYFNFTGITY